MNVSQPSVSAAIAHLERVFGVQLFVRHHAQGLSPTPAGRSLATRARGLLGHAEELRADAEGLGDSLAGELHVGCFVTFAPFVMPGLLRAFAERHPAIEVKLHEGHQEALLDGLRAGRVELALSYDLGLGADLAFTELAVTPAHAVLPADHPMAGQVSVSLAALAAEPYVLLDLPLSRDYFTSIFLGLGLEPRIAYRTPSFDMVRGMVANGYGYTLLNARPRNATALDGKPLVHRPLVEPVQPMRLGVARLESLRATRMATEFAEFCRAYFAETGAVLG